MQRNKRIEGDEEASDEKLSSFFLISVSIQRREQLHFSLQLGLVRHKTKATDPKRQK